jgi:DNA-binding response OmpR family regulator
VLTFSGLLHISPPRRSASVSCAIDARQETRIMRTHSTVLCIDDEKLELSIRKMVLESAGFDVLTAANAVRGLEVFKAHRIDLVITDHLGISGNAFISELRKLKPSLPIMVLSGGNIPRDPVSPPDYYLHKLEGPTEMIAKVQSAIVS